MVERTFRASQKFALGDEVHIALSTCRVSSGGEDVVHTGNSLTVLTFERDCPSPIRREVCEFLGADPTFLDPLSGPEFGSAALLGRTDHVVRK